MLNFKKAFLVVLAVLFALSFLSQLNIVPFVLATPSTIGATHDLFSLTMPGHHKVFYTQSHFFAFWFDNTPSYKIYYSSSSDGSSWTLLGNFSSWYPYDAYNDVFFDGTYVHICCRASPGMWYRRGTPQAGGTITWGSEQAVSTSGTVAADPSIAADSDGYVYIAWGGGAGNAYVTKNQNNDDTWVTQSGYPLMLESGSYKGALIIPLLSSRMYCLYANTIGTPYDSRDYIYGRLFNGSSWEAEIQVSTSLLSVYTDGLWGMTYYDDVIDLAFVEQATSDLQYIQYNGSAWGSEELIYAYAHNATIPSLSRVDSDTLYCFYPGLPTSNYVYYKIREGIVWGSNTQWYQETEGLTSQNNRMMVTSQALGSYIAIIYLSKSASPYNVRFEKLTLSPPSDTTIPTYSNVETNTTTASQPCMFSCKWQDNVALSGHIFSTNVTTSWVNETWASLGSNPAWANVTKTLPALGSVQYLWYCNDSSNNWATTSTFTLSVGMNPWYTTATHNATVQSKPVLFYSQWQDLLGLSGYIFGCNITGSFTNETWTAFSGNPAWANKTKTLPATVGTVVQYRWYANNSFGSWNNTDLLSLTVTASAYPVIIYFDYNSTTSDAPCLFSSQWTDDYGLSGYIFSWNNGTVWANDTWTALSGTNAWANSTKTLPSSMEIIQFLWYVNDTDGYITTTVTYSFDMAAYMNTYTNPDPSAVAYGTGFNLYFPATSTLAFQHLAVTYEAKAGTALFTVSSGTWNATNCELRMHFTGGSLYFEALDTATLTFSNTTEFNFIINGEIYNGTAVNIISGQAYTIGWQSLQVVWLIPFTFIIGMIGLVSAFSGPLYAIYKVKHGEYYEGFRVGVVVTAIGLALTIAWLWV